MGERENSQSTDGGRVFRRAHTVLFADVDAAGIVYYPRLLHYCHLTFEEFFPHAGERNYAQWIQEERIGFPTVHLDVDFIRPVEYGRPLTMTARVLRLGGRSVTFRFTGEREDGDTAFRADVTKACASIDDGRSRDMTPELRALFEAFLVEDPDA